MGWTMGLLPLPRDWSVARELLGPLGKKATRSECVTSDELLMIALDAYGLTVAQVEPLLTWSLATE